MRTIYNPHAGVPKTTLRFIQNYLVVAMMSRQSQARAMGRLNLVAEENREILCKGQISYEQPPLFTANTLKTPERRGSQASPNRSYDLIN